MPLINCKTNLILMLFPNCFVSAATGAAMFITHIKMYLPVVTQFKTTWNYCSTQNQDLKEQLTVTNINKLYRRKLKNNYLEYLIDPTFQGVNKQFILSFEIIQIEQCTQGNIFRK